MNSTPRLLVLTLHSGENEFLDCMASVAEQEGVAAEQIVYEGLGNIEGHKSIYSEIMRRCADFDLFLKLDADMVLNRSTALLEVYQFFRNNPELDHLSCLVNDHFTGKPMPAVHVFSPNVHWDLESMDALFVDPQPTYPGKGIFDPAEIRIFVEHAPNPGLYQAFHFGYHRALKAFQRDRENVSLFQKIYHLGVLIELEKHFRLTRRKDLALALIASEMVASGRLGGVSGDKLTHEVKAAFEEASTLDIASVMASAPLRQRALRLRMRCLRRLYMMHFWARSAVQRGKKWARGKIGSGSMR